MRTSRAFRYFRPEQPIQPDFNRSAFRSLSLAGADRFRTSNCWRGNAVSASRAACDLNSPSDPPSSFKKSIIPV
jgi:hypothetical protein